MNKEKLNVPAANTIKSLNIHGLSHHIDSWLY